MGALYGFTGPPTPELLRRMEECLSHRGGRDVLSVEAVNGSVGYRSVLDEPGRRRVGAGLIEEDGLVIGLAGYLLPSATSPENREGLESPTSVSQLPALYRREGPDCIARLRGAFALAIIDGLTLHLARDGAGVRTLYYGRHDGRYVFAIEPKGILAVPGFPRRLRPAAVAQYLSFSFVPGSCTMLADVEELLPGHRLSATGGAEPQLKRFFHFEQEEYDENHGNDESHGDTSRWVQQFREAVETSVADRLPPGEPTGVFLSGGLDSSVVTAAVARQHRGAVKTWSIHFGDRYPHELEFARAVAKRWKTDHQEVLIRPRQFLPRLRKIIWHLDDPIGDPITVPNFEIAAHAAREVRWVFNGEGGDPCFGGPKNLPMLLHHWYGGVRRDARFRERVYLASYRRGYEELARLLTPEWSRQIDFETNLEGVLTPYFREEPPVSFLNKLMAINIRLKGAHLILPKVERMMGAWGLLPLSPLFDEELVRMSFAMPPTLKLRGGNEKWILKRAYEGDLPPEIIARPKSGMRVPVHFWFQKEMRRYARKILSRRALGDAGIFEPGRVKQLLDYEIEEGPGRYGLRLWMLLTFEIWRRIVIEGEPL